MAATTVPATTEQATTEQAPNSQGCWIRYPSGCPKQKNKEKYDNLQNPNIWNHETFKGASESQDKCFARERKINKWCGVSNIVIQYLSGIKMYIERTLFDNEQILF